MKLLKTIMVVGVAAFFLNVANAVDKIAVISLQTVFQQAPQGQAALDRLKQQMTPQMNSLKKMQDQLNAAVTAFNKNSPTMSDADRTAQENALNQQQQKFQQQVNAFQTAQGQQQQAAAQNFQTDLVNAVQTVAKNDGYTLVMTDQTVPYYNPSYDISGEVVNLMKKMK